MNWLTFIGFVMLSMACAINALVVRRGDMPSEPSLWLSAAGALILAISSL